MVLFVLLGAFWYVIDRRFGVKWYRLWHNLTNKKPLPAEVEVGFIFNRKSRHKALMATLLSTVQTVAALYSIETINLLVELILWIVEVPMTMLGFMIGPWAYKLWKGRDDVFDALDEINAKDTKGKPLPEDVPETIEAEEVIEEKEEEKDNDEPEDPRDMMRRYTDKR
jgi:hypothetical protein